MSETPGPNNTPVERPTVGVMWANYQSYEAADLAVTASRWIALHLVADESPEMVYWALSGHAPLIATTSEGLRFTQSEPPENPSSPKGQLVDRRMRIGVPANSTDVGRKIAEEAAFLKVLAGRLSPILLRREMPDDVIITEADTVSPGDPILTAADFLFTTEAGEHDNINGETSSQLVEDIDNAKLFQRLNPRTRAKHARAESLIRKTTSERHLRWRLIQRRPGDPREKEIKDTINQVTRRKRMIRVAAAGIFMAASASLLTNLLHYENDNRAANAIGQTNSAEGVPTSQQQTFQTEERQTITTVSFMESAEQIPRDITEIGLSLGSLSALLVYAWVNGETKRNWAPKEAKRQIAKIGREAAKSSS